MPALISTDIVGKIMWLGCVPDRDANLASETRDEMFATFSGVADEDHRGLTRLSCSRVVTQYPKGTEIRNTRQFSVVSAEEIEAISTKIGIARLDPSWIGASIGIAGIPDFTHIPPSSRLQFDTGTTLVVDMENRPCHLPAKVIDGHLPGVGRAFIPRDSVAGREHNAGFRAESFRYVTPRSRLRRNRGRKCRN